MEGQDKKGRGAPRINVGASATQVERSPPSTSSSEVRARPAMGVMPLGRVVSPGYFP